MNDKTLSKFLSLVLRHEPQRAGIVLDDAGWVDVDELLLGCTRAGTSLTRTDLERIVAESDKQRFALSDDGLRIRASQGHSVRVELGYAPAVPPEILYHGTTAKVLDSIRATGLKPQSRHHVHLSPDEKTANAVGGRHGKPIVLKVRSGDMHRNGIIFYMSANGVWLTDHVAPEYLEFP